MDTPQYLVNYLGNPEFRHLHNLIDNPQGAWWDFDSSRHKDGSIPFTRKVCMEVKTSKVSSPQRYPSINPDNNFKPIWNSWLEALSTLRDRDDRLVSTGYSATRRSVIVVDIDDPMFSELEVNEKCLNLNIPLPSYYTMNKDTGHFHVAWLIKDFSIHKGISRDAYISLTRRMAREFGGDESYNGDYTRNPFCPRHQTSWISTEEHDITEFLNLGKYEEEDDVLPTASRKVTVDDTEWICSDSRNQFCIRNLRKAFNNDLKRKGWFGLSNEFIRKHYTMDMMFEVYMNLEYISLAITGKDEIEDTKAIQASVRNLYPKIINTYEQSKTKVVLGENEENYSSNRSEYHLDTKNYTECCHKAIRYLHALQLKEQGMNYRQIAEELNIARQTVKNLFSTYSTEQARDTLLKFLQANKEWTVKYQYTNFTDKFADLKEEVLEAVKEYFSDDEELMSFIPKVYDYEMAYREGDKEAVWKLYMEEMEYFSTSPSSMRRRAS